MQRALLLLTIIILIVRQSTLAQLCAPNNITTNPSAPVNNQRPSMINTFDWTMTDFSLNIRHIYNGNTSIRSPFFDSDNSIINEFYDPIPGPKDFLAGDDGWELIKKDFGFESGGIEVNNPYLILYNKYRGLLRVFIARGDQAFFNGAILKVKFLDISPMQTSLLDHAGELKAISAPFSRNPIIYSSSDILNGYEEWFYSDFPMNYDPCTCMFQSKIEIKVDLSNTATISLNGTTNGEIVSQGEPSSTQASRGSFTIGDLGAVAKKSYNTYKSLNSFKNDVIGKGGSSTGTNDLANKLKESNFLRSGLSAIPYVGAALSIVDFFTGGGRKTTAPQQVSVMPMSITMTSNYTGNITSEYPYASSTFRTPGSDPGNAPDSEYPYYNEVLGVLSALYVPKVNVQKSQRVVSRSLNNGGPYVEYTNKYRFSEPLKYVLNPAAGVIVEEIQAKIVLEGKNLSGTSNQGTNATSGKYETATSAVNLGCLTNTINTVIWDNSIAGYSISPTDNIRIKVIANLRRMDATANTQNILFVATYPAILTAVSNIGTTSTCSSPLQQPESATTVYNFCGQSIYTGSDRFLRTKSYDDLVKELENSERLSSEFEGDNDIQLYPNPAHGLIKIDYTLNETSNVKISIVNSTGNIARVALNEIKEAGKHEQKLDVVEYTSGLYILILEYSNVRKVKKFLVND